MAASICSSAANWRKRAASLGEPSAAISKLAAAEFHIRKTEELCIPILPSWQKFFSSLLAIFEVPKKFPAVRVWVRACGPIRPNALWLLKLCQPCVRSILSMGRLSRSNPTASMAAEQVSASVGAAVRRPASTNMAGAWSAARKSRNDSGLIQCELRTVAM